MSDTISNYLSGRRLFDETTAFWGDNPACKIIEAMRANGWKYNGKVSEVDIEGEDAAVR